MEIDQVVIVTNRSYNRDDYTSLEKRDQYRGKRKKTFIAGEKIIDPKNK